MKGKFILTIVLMSMAALSLSAQGYSGGSGTAADPYQIANKADLLYLGTNTTHYSKHFIMTADIDLAGEVFDRAVIAPDTDELAYGYQGEKFTGSFDGNGHTIFNLTIEGSVKRGGYLGLFGYVQGAECCVRKLGLVRFFICGGVDSDNSGGVCGRSDGLLAECYSIGSVDAGDDSNSLGVLCGHNSGTIKNCYSQGSVHGGDKSWALGGLCGKNENGFINDCYSGAFVRGYSSSGGLCGYSTGGSVNSCFWDIDTSELMNSAGGSGLTNAEMEEPGNFLAAGWGFANEITNGTNDYWKMAGYPVLNWQNGHSLAVIDGEGDGVYNTSESVVIVFDKGPGHTFTFWNVAPAEYINNFEDIFSSETTFVIPSTNVIITAVYDSYSGGTGSQENPYRLSNKKDFLGLSATPSDYGKSFVLTADIDLIGETFTKAVIASDTYSDASGFQGRAFTGGFDGGGYVVKNVSINTGGDGNDYLGLFGCISGTSSFITNLGAVGINIIGGAGSVYMGGVCGYNDGGRIGGCYSSGNIESQYASDSLGGLCGYNNSGTLGNSCSAVAVSGDKNLGGLCGVNDGGTISGCYSTGDVSGNQPVGGLCGLNNFGSISNCYAVGSITGVDKLGGLCGKNSGMISGCYAIGLVSGDGDDIGALCGSNSGNVSTCYFYLWGGLAVGPGKPLSKGELLISGTYVGFDFTGDARDGTDEIWSITPGHLPALSWQEDKGSLPPAYGPPATTLSGKGTPFDPFMINTPDDFEEFYTNTDLDKGYYQLNTDVDLSGITFSTAVVNRTFSGVFDGNGHVVCNVLINTTSSNLGLFSTVLTSIINLRIENIIIDGGAGSDYVGGLCGSNYGVISDCRVANSAIDGSDYLGSLCGYNYGTVNNCYAEGSIRRQDFSSSSSFGGLCGANTGLISGCYVVCVISGESWLGGISGYNSGTISDCCTIGRVSVSNGFGGDYLGGLCGENDNDGVVKGCSSKVDISCEGYSVGGLCGYNAGLINGCHAGGRIIGRRQVGGLCGANGGEIICSYSEGSVSYISDDGYYSGYNQSYGGLCGYNFGLLDRCYSTGDVIIDEEVYAGYLGGLCGYNNDGTIRDCYALGVVYSGRYVGGLCGYSKGGEIYRCYSAGFVDGIDYLGGLCGWSASSIRKSFWNMDTSGINYSSSGDGITYNKVGSGLTTPEMQTQSIFVSLGWDFVGETVNGTNDTWIMDGYPKLNYEYHYKYSGGSGTETDPFIISSKLDLMCFSTNVADYGSHFLLTADINLNGYVLERALIAPDTGELAFGFQGTKFTGGLDGKGHSIFNLTIDTHDTGGDYLGLFGCVSGPNCYIRNLELVDVSVMGGNGSDFIGGLCGQSEYGVFSNCHVSGRIAGGDYAGGLCGYNSGDTELCSNRVSVSGKNNVGGLFGWHAYAVVSNCCVQGSVVGVDNVGGFCGRNNQGVFSGCYSANRVAGNSHLGGFCGYSYNGLWTACYWDRELSEVTESAGALGLSTAEMMEQSTFESSGWNFTKLWRMNLYPAFSWRGNSLTVINGSGSDWYLAHEEVEIVADVPPAGYQFSNWSILPAQCGSGLFDLLASSATFLMPATNVSITAVYREFEYLLQVVDGTTSGKYNTGDLIELRADVIDGYVFSHWLIEPSEFSANLADHLAPVTDFVMPSTNLSLTAIFSRYSGGSGTPENPFIIATKKDLLAMGHNPRDYDGHFVLTSDIDLADEIFVTALIAPDSLSADGYQGTAFSGAFDGGGHVVSNLTIMNDKMSIPYLGLFGYISGPFAVISNLGVTNFKIIDLWSTCYAGGLCGAISLGTINKCYATGAVNCADYSDHLGVLCGNNAGGVINDCHSIGVVKGRNYLGGLCGYNAGTLRGCYSMGSVKGAYYLGGLCGRNYYGTVCESYSTAHVEGVQFFGGFCGQCYGGSISNCYSTGDVNGGDGHHYYGGFCGGFDAGAIACCFSIGRVIQGAYGSNIGGFCGRNNVVPGKCFWNTESSSRLTSAGGTGKTTAQMQTESTFTAAGWDFSDIWYMDAYPALRCFNTPGTYAHWLMDAGIPPGARGWSDTPAFDGVPNLMKYACGLPAMEACTTADLMTIDSSTPSVFSVLYYKSKNAQDVTLRPLWAASLHGPWSTLGLSTELIGTDAEREQWKASIPLGASGFIRLRAAQ